MSGCFIVLKDHLYHFCLRLLFISFCSSFSTTYIGQMIHHPKVGDQIKQCSQQLPDIDLEASIQPITRTVLRVRLTITPMFRWNDRVHGTASESWWIWVEDPENNHIYHSEYFLLHKKQVSIKFRWKIIKNFV